MFHLEIQQEILFPLCLINDLLIILNSYLIHRKIWVLHVERNWYDKILTQDLKKERAQ